MRSVHACLALVLLAAASAGGPAVAETVVGPGVAPEITIYGDFALVRERRSVRLAESPTQLAFTGVSRALQPETAAVQVAEGETVKPADVRILDQTFAFNLMSQQSLLEQSVGKEVSVAVTNPATGRDILERARVLSAQNGLVLEIAGKIHVGTPGRIVFDGLPGNLRAQPTLLVTASGPVGSDIPLALSYITGGLGWRADYVAAYDPEGGRLDLTGWATVTNTAGVAFKDARLKLAAGDVHRASAPPRPVPRGARMEMAMAAAPQAEASAPQSVAGLNIYPIGRPVSLSPGESKQIALLRAVNLPVKRDYVVRGEPWFYTTAMTGQRQEGRAEIEIAIRNEGRKAPKGKGAPEATDVPALGIALPAGVVRAYGDDVDGAAQFLGEDRIDSVAEGGEFRLHLGRDVELPTVREQVSFVRASDTIALSVWRLTLRNAKAKPVSVKISEPVGGAWEIAKENQAHVKSAAGTPEWTLTVPPKGETVLEYTVKSTS
jgi:hypothetical protein